MIPRRRFKTEVKKKRKKTEKGDLVGIIQDNDLLNPVYDLLFRSRRIDYRIFHFIDDYQSFVEETDPRSIVLDFENPDYLARVMAYFECRSEEQDCPQLIYHGVNFQKDFCGLNDRIIPIRFGEWYLLLDNIEKAKKGSGGKKDGSE